jgi:hypothetical protein
VLLVGQTAPAENGLWVVNTGGAWTRPSNFTTNAAVQGCFCAVVKGTLRKGWIFQNTNTNTITVGSTSLTFDRVADRFDRADLATASATPGANILARFGASSELQAAYFRGTAAIVGGSGLLRGTNVNQVLIGARDNANSNNVDLFVWGVTAADELDVGSTFVDAINFNVKATKTFRWKDDGTAFATLTKAGGMSLTGTGGFAGPYFATGTGNVAGTGLLRANDAQAIVVARKDADVVDVNVMTWGIAGTDELGIGDASVAAITMIGGNIALFDAGSFGDGEGVIFIKNAAVEPTTNPTDGVLLYAFGGALKARGSGGTVTTVAPA